MKKLTLMTGILLSSLFSLDAQAQKHEIQFNALGTLLNCYGVTYERSFIDSGWATGVFYFTNPSSFDYDYSAFSLTSEYRFYFKGEEEGTGYFVAPYLNYRYTAAPDYATINANDIEKTTNGLAIGINTGKKWAHRTGFIYGTHIGIGRYVFDEASYSGGYEPDDFDSGLDELPKLDFRLGVNIGFRF